MQRSCTQCSAYFDVTDEDIAFYDEISPKFVGKTFQIPSPKHCPDCRHQRRMAFRNERTLYKRICDATGESIVSIYPPDTAFPVFNYESWWSDNWNPMQYGRMYDLDRSFFEQFLELMHAVPRLGIVTGHNENCGYCNYVNYSKDSYLCFGCHSVDHCFHNWRAHWSEHCVDCLQMDRCEYCYECIDCEGCYGLSYSQDCENCNDSVFLYDCKACKDCIGCANLRNKQYCISNKQLSKEEFETQKKNCRTDTFEGIEALKPQFHSLLHTVPHKNVFLTNAENVTGDHIMNGKNLYECYHVKNAEDCRYLESCEEIKSSMDNTFSGWPAERVYETMSSGVNCYNHLFCTASWNCSNLLYCDSCHHSNNLFGCIGLHNHNEYCILNKQYDKETYDSLCASIITNMIDAGEWGMFFPQKISPHGIDETVAMEFYPITEDAALKRGFSWKGLREEAPNATKTIPGMKLPSSISEVPEDVLNWAIVCDETLRPFKIIKQELDFYRQMDIPLPRIHPDERHRRRMAMRNPRKLWEKACAKCGNMTLTTYAPDRAEIVYCESCYLAEVY